MTQHPTVAPYGSWASPITTAMLTEASIGLSSAGTDGNDLFWLESRASEGGRATLLRLAAGSDTPVELTPAPFNVRSRVHEYGGGAWTSAEGLVIFSNFADNRLYRIDPDGGEPTPITPEGAYRYADLRIDAAHDRLVAVREDHSLPDTEAVNTIVTLTLSGPNADGGRIIVSGTDFVAAPRLNATGTKLAWLSWDHPNMPWDASELWAADIAADGTLSDPTPVAGGAGDSASEPHWLADDSLVFIAERTGWWNLYRAIPGEEPTALHPAEAEFGVPQWVFGQSSFDVVNDTTLIVTSRKDGIVSLGTLDLTTGALTSLDVPFTTISDVHALANGTQAILIGGNSTTPTAVATVDLASSEVAIVKRSREADIDPASLSVPESITWTAPDGSPVYGFYYAPTNGDFVAPEGELPPVIVESHGGPTGSTSSSFSLAKQYWTSRGFAILDVNYGGSTGYGRAYRERLKDAWGIVDIDDCVSGVEHLVAIGKADPKRLIIRGGSAGGYTTLAALTFRDTFSAGTSYFGIGDLEALAKETHKFESRYLDGLIGPYPEAIATYHQRSPIHHTERLSSAMLLFQGLDDKVVPPNQAQMMADAVREKGLPVAHVEYEGEGHGFRKAENIQLTAERELSFYAQLFGFTPAGESATLAIDNLPSGQR